MTSSSAYALGVLVCLALAGSLCFIPWGSGAAAGTSGAVTPGPSAPSPSGAGAPAPADPAPPEDGKLRILAFGAHPDDCEVAGGGTACLWADGGHHVKFVSATSGDIGHWQMAGGPLARRRLEEVKAAAKIIGNVVQVLDVHDGELEPTLENRRAFTRLIRGWNADIVIGHRPCDYHPDHRYAGILVQDSAYMVTVPFFCPDTPALKKNPVFLYFWDSFQKPVPFRPDIVVSIDAVIDRKMDAAAQMISQFIEEGCGGGPASMPRDEADLKARQEQFKKGFFRQQCADVANMYRDKLVELYGEAGKQVRHAEAFEVCEYGRAPSAEELRKLFPFVPPKK
jgi:LmbE family N-acetylglucosaminyl deacetylase